MLARFRMLRGARPPGDRHLEPFPHEFLPALFARSGWI